MRGNPKHENREIRSAYDLKRWRCHQRPQRSARASVPGKRGSMPNNVPPVLRRLGLDSKTWCELVRDFGKLFCHVAGRPEHVDTIRTHRTHRRFYLRRRSRELFASTQRGRILITRTRVTVAFMPPAVFAFLLSIARATQPRFIP
jgi:hypothetical protein